ncbi:MAG: HEAT repeat domain-containing protein [Cyanobacteria bacterium J06649_4]
MVRSIELPEALAQRLETFAGSANMGLPELALKVLSLLAELATSLESSDPSVSVKALRQLGNIDSAAALPILLRALQDDELVVRDEPANMLENLHSSEATEDSLTQDFDSLLSLAGTMHFEDVNDLGSNHDKYIAEVLEQELLPDK